MVRAFLFTTIVMIALPVAAHATEPGPVFEMIIQNHMFTPAQLTVPANKRFTIHVKNLDPLAEEFDSTDLKVEKVIAGKGEGDVHLHALDPGTYHFMGEYHSETAQGVVVAK